MIFKSKRAQLIFLWPLYQHKFNPGISNAVRREIKSILEVHAAKVSELTQIDKEQQK